MFASLAVTAIVCKPIAGKEIQLLVPLAAVSCEMMKQVRLGSEVQSSLSSVADSERAINLLKKKNIRNTCKTT